MRDPVLKAFMTPAFVSKLRLDDLRENYPANGDILVCERYLSVEDSTHSGLSHEERIKRAAALCRAIRNAEAAAAPAEEASARKGANGGDGGRSALVADYLATGASSGLSVEDQIAALGSAIESLRTPGARGASLRGLARARRPSGEAHFVGTRAAEPLDLRAVPGANRTLKAINVLRAEVPAFQHHPWDIQIREATKALRERGYLE